MRVLLGPTISSQLWSRHLEFLALKPRTCLQRLEEESMQSHEAKSRAILIQQMFMALQCGNAASVLGTMGPVPSGYT